MLWKKNYNSNFRAWMKGRVGGVVDVKKARMTMVHKQGKHKDDNKNTQKNTHLKHYQVREWITAGALLQHHTTTCSSMLATFTWKKVKGEKKTQRSLKTLHAKTTNKKNVKRGMNSHLFLEFEMAMAMVETMSQRKKLFF